MAGKCLVRAISIGGSNRAVSMVGLRALIIADKLDAHVGGLVSGSQDLTAGKNCIFGGHARCMVRFQTIH